MVSVKIIDSQNILTKSKLPDADYVINPYLGCPHKCIYCYAEFMTRFSKHNSAWGDFLDVKDCNKEINKNAVDGKTVLISSVTDAYNMFEKKYEKTRKILKELINTNAYVDILTKSSLVCRDLDILKQLNHIKVGISINTLEDTFRSEIEPRAGTVEERLKTLKLLKAEGIETYVFIGPIFPGITDIKKLVDTIGNDVEHYYFENLNLRGAYKNRVLEYINDNWPELNNLYHDIYINKSNTYWDNLLNHIENIFSDKNLLYKCYFYHEKIKKK